jgi:uncharacterized membrane protein YhaH (DUF805 family)
VTARRFHDTGHSGLYFLMVLVPFVGFILVLVRLCQPGHPSANKYGPVPRT